MASICQCNYVILHLTCDDQCLLQPQIALNPFKTELLLKHNIQDKQDLLVCVLQHHVPPRSVYQTSIVFSEYRSTVLSFVAASIVIFKIMPSLSATALWHYGSASCSATCAHNQDDLQGRTNTKLSFALQYKLLSTGLSFRMMLKPVNTHLSCLADHISKQKKSRLRNVIILHDVSVLSSWIITFIKYSALF